MALRLPPLTSSCHSRGDGHSFLLPLQRWISPASHPSKPNRSPPHVPARLFDRPRRFVRQRLTPPSANPHSSQKSSQPECHPLRARHKAHSTSTARNHKKSGGVPGRAKTCQPALVRSSRPTARARIERWGQTRQGLDGPLPTAPIAATQNEPAGSQRQSFHHWPASSSSTTTLAGGRYLGCTLARS